MRDISVNRTVPGSGLNDLDKNSIRVDRVTKVYMFDSERF